MAHDDKAQLFKKIATHANEWTVLERMRVHGFWPYGQGLPQDPTGEALERTALQKQIAELRRSSAKIKDPDKALAVERKRRWDESRARRAAAKAQRIKLADDRRAAWNAYRKVNLVYAGEGVSAGLQGQLSDTARLEARGLPVMHRAQDVAAKMSVTLTKLRWLTYHRRGATLVHYHRYGIPKKTGGIRNISAPKRALGLAQRWVFVNVLGRLEPEPEAHGFVEGRSIVSNAAPHAGRAFVTNLDLCDFFPSITFRRVKGLFQGIGYSEHVATVLALLCTEPPRVPARLDGKLYFVALGQRVLPQGACTSPAITNALCRRLDRRLRGLAARHACTYTRYADDLTFSGDEPRVVGRLLKSVRAILIAEGFAEHTDKTRVMRDSQRQEVTGVVVNTRPKISREQSRELRAILHNAARHGLASQNRDGRDDFAAFLKGRVEFACMVDPARAAQWRTALARALSKHEAP